MISILVCSVSPDRLKALQSNIESTIGVPFELLHIDNKVEGRSLCNAYNELAQRAQYPMVCFAHEDIAFHSEGWGKAICEKLEQHSTGVIGFAGSAAKTKTLSGWTIDKKHTRINLTETANGATQELYSNPTGEDFAQVVTLDGLCLFARREVWDEVHFDEDMLRGFHLYDLDFTTAVHVAGYRNYVCNVVRVEHFSSGSFSREWYDAATLYTHKWSGKLPLYVGPTTAKEVATMEKRTYRRIAYMLIKKCVVPRSQAREYLRGCVAQSPLNFANADIIFRYIKNSNKFPKN